MKVIRPWLSVGKFLEPRDRELMVSSGVQAILALYWPVEHEGIESLYLPVEDGVPLKGEVLRRGVEFILQHKAQGHGVLVACRAGISRSLFSATASAAILLVQGVCSSLQKRMRIVRFGFGFVDASRRANSRFATAPTQLSLAPGESIQLIESL